MAKYAKRKKKTTHRRRRRVGAMSLTASNPLFKYGPIVAGYFLGDKINTAIDTATGGKIDTKIVGIAEAGLGAFLVFSKGKPSLIKSVAGGVALGAGIKRLMAAFGVGYIGGYGAVPVIGNRGARRMNGYGSVPVIGRSGMQGYAPNGQLGAYGVPNNVKVMNGVGTMANGSGLSNGGSDVMQ